MLLSSNLVTGMCCAGSLTLQGAEDTHPTSPEHHSTDETTSNGDADNQGDQPDQPLLVPSITSSSASMHGQADAANQQGSQPRAAGPQHQQAALSRQQADDDAESDEGLPDAIKLGLGDFIFYSVLVGRAAMYDMLTAIVSYVAVMAGLGITLLLLALNRQALPALPVSIALGVLFYSLARFILEPFVLNLSTNLVFV